MKSVILLKKLNMLYNMPSSKNMNTFESQFESYV